MGGKSRPVGWRPDLIYLDQPERGWMFRTVSRKNEEWGLTPIDSETWASEHRARMHQGTEFQLREGPLLVATGVVTRIRDGSGG
jgi:hypothetical protein